MKKIIIVIILLIIISICLYFIFYKPLQVQLTSPETNYLSRASDLKINFVVSQSYLFTKVKNCSLYLNEEIKATIDYVTKGIEQTFNIKDLSNGTYEWKILCNDNMPFLSKPVLTETRKILIINEPINLVNLGNNEVINTKSTDLIFSLNNYPPDKMDECQIYLNGNIVSTVNDVKNSETETIKLENLTNGPYKLRVSCLDQSNFQKEEIFESKEGAFTVLIPPKSIKLAPSSAIYGYKKPAGPSVPAGLDSSFNCTSGVRAKGDSKYCYVSEYNSKNTNAGIVEAYFIIPKTINENNIISATINADLICSSGIGLYFFTEFEEWARFGEGLPSNSYKPDGSYGYLSCRYGAKESKSISLPIKIYNHQAGIRFIEEEATAYALVDFVSLDITYSEE